MATSLRNHANPDQLLCAETYRSAHLALHKRDYALASKLFYIALQGQTICDRDRLILLFIANIEKIARGKNLSTMANSNRILPPLPATLLTGEADRNKIATYEAALAKLAAPE